MPKNTLFILNDLTIDITANDNSYLIHAACFSLDFERNLSASSLRQLRRMTDEIIKEVDALSKQVTRKV